MVLNLTVRFMISKRIYSLNCSYLMMQNVTKYPYHNLERFQSLCHNKLNKSCINNHLRSYSVQSSKTQPADFSKKPGETKLTNVAIKTSPKIVSDTVEKSNIVDANLINEEYLKAKPDGIFTRFKKMYKEYWYILLPVHVVTSVMWFGGFYYISQSGVDIPAFMESMGLSERYIQPLRNSKLGHVAVAYLLYKVATPLRYTVTLGGTTVSIKYLVKGGYIKPVPSKIEFLKKYKARRDARREKE